MKQNITYETIKESIEKTMKFENDNDYLIDLVIATALSIHLDRPIWLMLVAPPSSGKTEIMKIIYETTGYHSISGLTNRALFSGHPTAQGGYVPREVGNMGIMCFPDFTTVLCQPSPVRNEIFNQLRILYDGKSSFTTGIDTSSSKPWEGKIAILASVTETIEKIRERNTDLGERFLYYNFIPTTLDDAILKFSSVNSISENEVPLMVKEFITEKIDVLAGIKISDENKKLLLSMAKFVCHGRALVDRDGYSRLVTQVHQAESPFRVFTALCNLYISIMALHGDEERTIKIIKAVCKSSILKNRSDVLKLFGNQTEPIPTNHFIEKLPIDQTIVRRVLEDMHHQRMVVQFPSKGKNQLNYSLAPDFRKLYDEISR